MLKHLYIKNFALIDTLDIDFREGFSVITGETGAGKSIILGAINLLLGQRADSKMVKMGAQKCVIEAEFAGDIILRRELTASGKSRAFIDDSPVSLGELKELGSRLIDIHSQHKNLLVGDSGFQLGVLDGAGAVPGGFTATYREYTAIKAQVKALQQSIEESRRDEDYLRFQQEKLAEIDLKPGMVEELEQEQETLAHAEEIKSALYEADNILSGDSRGYNTVDGLREVLRKIEGLLDVYPSIEEVYNRLSDAYEDIKDLSDEVSDAAESIDDDPTQLEAINDKLDKIYSLLKKYHKQSVEELIAYKQEIDEKLAHIDNSDEELAALMEALSKAYDAAKAEADKLTALRMQAAEEVEKKMIDYLVPLGIPKAQFKVDITDSKELLPTGQDIVQFLFSANTSTPLSPISQVASGGEIARVMLSLKAMTAKRLDGYTDNRPNGSKTIIFDEIDTGVSGKIAEKMALIMAEMAESNGQIISITHLPQIAARGTTHYKVLKEETEQGTTSRMTMLNNDERVTEIAQMLSGSDVTEAAIQNAKELLKI